MTEEILWYNLKISQVLKKLKTSDSGLTDQQVAERLKRSGLNRLPSEKNAGYLSIFFQQFKNPLVYVLLGAALITFILQDFIDLIIILMAVAINTILGFYQEVKANRAIVYLKKMVDLHAKVLRNGNKQEIKAQYLVPGDIIFVQAGDKIPADARIIESENFQVIEATLTGESAPSDKHESTLNKGTTLADRENMIYSGTVAAKGISRAVVCATGINTELGQITNLIQEIKEGKTPLQRQLDVFSQHLTYIVIFICSFLIIAGKLQGRVVFGFGSAAREGMFNTAVAIAVAAIPEGLLIAVTAILAMGMRATLKKKALIRKLIAAETLGSVSIICTDKTGTLTEGKMQVSAIITLSQEIGFNNNLKYTDSKTLKDHDLILKMCLLCNDAFIQNPQENLSDWKISGSPTETALLLAAVQAGIPYLDLLHAQPRLAELPFDSEFKYMATLNKLDDLRNVIYIKGTPEKIIEISNQVRIDGRRQTLTSQRKNLIKAKYEKLTSQGLRVLAFAYKHIAPEKEKQNGPLDNEIQGMTFVGLVALKDPLRPETKETFMLAKKAGIRPIVVTGDHSLTAKAIVNELGIKVTDDKILEGKDMDQLSDEQLLKKIKDIDVYARVEPKHKLRIIDAWQKKGEVVAMTGDGVNDAPAIKAADIGIALGSGTDVAKETSDMILLDNNFKTIVAAINQGRVIFDNIKKVILYLLSDSFSEMVLISGALFFGLPLPLLPAQIIWINLITDGLPNVALTFEPGEKEVMKEKPRKKNTPILNFEMKILIFIIGILTDIVLLLLFYFLIGLEQLELNHIRTFIFAALGLDSLFYVFACRSLRRTIFNKNLFSNKFLIVSVLVGFLLQLAAIYQPHLQKIFDTVPLNLSDWIFILALANMKLLAIEVTKKIFIIKNKRHGYA